MASRAARLAVAASAIMSLAVGSEWVAAQSSKAALADAAPPASSVSATANPMQRPERRSGRLRVLGSTIDARVQGLTERLGLTEAQQAKVKAILTRRQADAARMHSDASMSARDRGHAVYNADSQAAEQIRALLNPEQLRKFGARPLAITPPSVASPTGK